MWCDWHPEIIERDFATLEEYGFAVVRVFPLWSEFQPVSLLTRYEGVAEEYCGRNEEPLEPDADGVDSEMLCRFRAMLDLAQKHHLKVITALLTGWMSGRLFVPPVLENRNLLTDPDALRWESRFIRRFVREFKAHPAIIAWEPGNECNCMSPLEKREEAASWHWQDFVVKAIHEADPSRPIYSGMHGALSEPREKWNLLQQGELYSGLTTHPYPLFTPACGRSALNTLPAVFHSTAETLFYRGISGKPAIIEEIGTLGPGMLSEKRTADYIRIAVLSAWAHNCQAFLWWCAFDQGQLDHAPYRWQALERELGLFHVDHQPHPAAVEAKKTLSVLKELPFEKLPPRKVDALVISTSFQNQWITAYGAFVLAKQAGFEVEYTSVHRCHVPAASFYWVPGINCSTALHKGYYQELRKHIHAGASLLVTDTGRGILQPFKEFFGCEIEYTALTQEEVQFDLPNSDEVIQITRETTRKLFTGAADVLIQAKDGSPLLTMNVYGKGKVFYLNCAPELVVLNEKIPQWYRVYRMIARLTGLDLPEKAPEIGRTLHEFPDGRAIEIELNYADYEVGGIAANSMRINKV